MPHEDWLPHWREITLAMAKDWSPVLNGRKASWNVADALISELGDLTEDAENALAAVNNESTKTPVAVARCRTAFRALEAFMRDLKKRHFFSPPLTDADRTALGLRGPDTTPTPHPTPGLKPDTEAEPWGKGRHRVTALNPETHNKKKPPLVKGVAFAYHVRDADAPKQAAADMPSVFQAGTERSFQWTEADYGRVADYAAAYENEGGKRGPWSDVVSVIIA
jgi:hypothetical protein